MTLVQVRELGVALQQMAAQHLALEGRIADTQHLATRANSRLDQAAEVIGGLQRRGETLEDTLHPHASIDEEQVAHLSSTVKALGEQLTSVDSTKNHYQGVFSELYRRFGVSGYKLIRHEQYDVVLAFLEDWRKAAAPPPAQDRERETE